MICYANLSTLYTNLELDMLNISLEDIPSILNICNNSKLKKQLALDRYIKIL